MMKSYHLQRRHTPIKKALRFAMVLALALTLPVVLTMETALASEDIPYAHEQAADWAALSAAVSTAPGSAPANEAPYIIELTAGIEIPASATLTIGPGKNIALIGDFSLIGTVVEELNLPNITIENGGALTLDGITVTSSGEGGGASGVLINRGGTLIMEGGAICGINKAGESGGGVYNDGGAFIMNGGEISGNASCCGGGVFNGEDSVFTMNGGKISGNMAAFNGGGVRNNYNAEFTMAGGEISGNETGCNGGGVYNGACIVAGGDNSGGAAAPDNVCGVNNGACTVVGGENSGGAAASDNVCGVNNGACTVAGGENSGGVAASDIGCCLHSGACTVIGSKDNSGEPAPGNSGIATPEEGELAGGAAMLDGADVCSLAGVFIMAGGEISGNIAGFNGGGVYNESESGSTINGGTISGNLAGLDGGGVYAASLSELTITGEEVLFSGNRAAIAYDCSEDEEALALHREQIPEALDNSWSLPTQYAYNNYDINYTNGIAYPNYTVTVVNSFPVSTGAKSDAEGDAGEAASAIRTESDAESDAGEAASAIRTESDTESDAGEAGSTGAEDDDEGDAGEAASAIRTESYAAGYTVTISAGNRDGYAFSSWTAEAGLAELSEAGNPKISFIMPAYDVTITANWTYYEDLTDPSEDEDPTDPSEPGDSAEPGDFVSQTDPANQSEPTGQSDSGGQADLGSQDDKGSQADKDEPSDTDNQASPAGSASIVSPALARLSSPTGLTAASDPDDTTGQTDTSGQVDETDSSDTDAPGGGDADVPPTPHKQGNTVEPAEDDTWIENDGEGNPLGEWRWDEDEQLWVFSEYAASDEELQSGDDLDDDASDQDAPGGADPDKAPRPNLPGSTIKSGDNGAWIEVGEEGAPLGEWQWDEEAQMWIFDEYPPLDGVPQTSSAELSLSSLYLLAFSLLGMGMILRFVIKR
jgi:uncharacterized repeat protein (TIGR02543 family)